MERPIIFNGAMSLAVIEGRKTVTRRPIKPQPGPSAADRYIDAYCGQPKTEANPRGMSTCWTWWLDDGRKGADIGTCPFGVPGDKLWVREAWSLPPSALSIYYRAGNGGRLLSSRDASDNMESVNAWVNKLSRVAGPSVWAPSIHMPRWASRTVLDVLDVRVERLQDITDEGARAEGFASRVAFIETWDAIYPSMPFHANPWVWRIEFKGAGSLQ